MWRNISGSDKLDVVDGDVKDVMMGMKMSHDAVKSRLPQSLIESLIVLHEQE